MPLSPICLLLRRDQRRGELLEAEMEISDFVQEINGDGFSTERQLTGFTIARVSL
jgi:hypothetical protein